HARTVSLQPLLTRHRLCRFCPIDVVCVASANTTTCISAPLLWNRATASARSGKAKTKTFSIIKRKRASENVTASPRVCLCTHHKAKTGRTCLPGSFDVSPGGRPSRHLCFSHGILEQQRRRKTSGVSALDIVRCASARIVKQET
ncbi:hypothetical protein BHM03_00012664, partial [Ensete ventricosum]